MLCEVSRKQINVSKHEETTLSWEKSVLIVCGYKNLHLIDFSYNLHSLEKEIDIKEFCLSASYDSPVPTNFLSNYAAKGIKNLELMEMITDPAFWPHHKMLTQEMTTIVRFKWSPESLIENNQCILSTVNSVGNIEFFVLNNQMWVSIMDFSMEMMKHLNYSQDLLNKCPKEFNELKNVVYTIETSTVCWAPELNSDKSSYLATIQKSGEILFWLLKYQDNALQTYFCNGIKNSNELEVPFSIWIPLDKDKFLLVFSNNCGQVFANKFEIVNNNFILIQEYNFWPFKDKMIVTYLDYVFDNDKLIIFFYKNRHLIGQMYNKSLKLLSQCVKNVNDFKITFLTKSKNEFYVCTVNAKIYKIEYSINNDVFDINLSTIKLKEEFPNTDLFGLCFSTNNAIVALGLFDRQLLIRKQALKIEIIFLTLESELEASAMAILNNPTKKIIKVWDHIELLRCKVIRAKRLPDLDYNTLLKEGEFDVYKLKVYLVFLTLYHSLEKLMTPCLNGKFPETSTRAIKDRLLLSQCISTINNLHAKYEGSNVLSGFEKECFEYSKRFLHYFCKTYSRIFKDYISESNLNVPCGHIEHICQACDEVIVDFSCKNGHINMFCTLTLTPIEQDEYLICKCCSSTARIELYNQNPMCVFCDICLNKTF